MDQFSTFIGLDLGDKHTRVCVTDRKGSILREFRMDTKREAIVSGLAPWPGARVALETGTHAPWMARLLEEAGFSPVVANARQVALIHANAKKSDTLDARMLARLVRVDPEMLCPVHVRRKQTQCDLETLKARDSLVRARSSLINHVRSAVKSEGHRLEPCSADAFARQAPEQLPESLGEALRPIVETIREMTDKIRGYDARIKTMCETNYPHTALLREVTGVGPITALAFVLTIESPDRFRKSRQVPAYFGLVPRRDQSGEWDPQLGITHAGNPYVRRLLVSSAHYILGPFGPDCALRRWGLAKAEGGKRAKRRAVVAVARKLAVLLHSLWINGMVYEPFPDGACPDGDEQLHPNEAA